jgi:hypothetical protein
LQGPLFTPAEADTSIDNEPPSSGCTKLDTSAFSTQGYQSPVQDAAGKQYCFTYTPFTLMDAHCDDLNA